jgi:membrane protease YdiL (CAAX protease family)
VRVRNFFVNPTEHRLRAAWRLSLHLGLLVFLMLVFQLVAAFAANLFGVFGAEADTTDVGLLISGISTLLAVTLSVILARRFLDRRGLASLGLRRLHASRTGAARDLAFGFLLAGAMMALIFVLELALGWTHFERFTWLAAGREPGWRVAGWLVLFLLVGWYEELLSRGYWLANLRDGLNTPLAVLLTAAAFALLHGSNPNSSWLSTAGLFFAGLWFAYGVIGSRGLWLPIGAHIGWNIFEGVVFGFPVSGLQTAHLIEQTASGPALWTGAAFGPEAGLVLLPALALGALGIRLYTKNRSAFDRPAARQ